MLCLSLNLQLILQTHFLRFNTCTYGEKASHHICVHKIGKKREKITSYFLIWNKAQSLVSQSKVTEKALWEEYIILLNLCLVQTHGKMLFLWVPKSVDNYSIILVTLIWYLLLTQVSHQICSFCSWNINSAKCIAYVIKRSKTVK